MGETRVERTEGLRVLAKRVWTTSVGVDAMTLTVARFFKLLSVTMRIGSGSKQVQVAVGAETPQSSWSDGGLLSLHLPGQGLECMGKRLLWDLADACGGWPYMKDE